MLGVEGAQFALLQTGVQFDLVDRRDERAAVQQALEMGGLEVRHARGAEASFLDEAFERTPGVGIQIAGRSRPVDQVEVETIEAERGKAGVEGAEGGVVT